MFGIVDALLCFGFGNWTLTLKITSESWANQWMGFYKLPHIKCVITNQLCVQTNTHLFFEESIVVYRFSQLATYIYCGTADRYQ